MCSWIDIVQLKKIEKDYDDFWHFCTPRLKTWKPILPYWENSQGDCEDHFKCMKDIQKEVTGVIKINSLFNILHILPITYLGDYLTISFTISRLVMYHKSMYQRLLFCNNVLAKAGCFCERNPCWDSNFLMIQLPSAKLTKFWT